MIPGSNKNSHLFASTAYVKSKLWVVIIKLYVSVVSRIVWHEILHIYSPAFHFQMVSAFLLLDDETTGPKAGRLKNRSITNDTQWYINDVKSCRKLWNSWNFVKVAESSEKQKKFRGKLRKNSPIIINFVLILSQWNKCTSILLFVLFKMLDKFKTGTKRKL